MRKVIVSEFLTLDGVMQGPGGSDEDREGGFEHGGWQGPYWDDEQAKAIDEVFAETDGFLLGRKTYEIFAGYWPTATEAGEFADVMNEMPTFVASRTLKEPLEWQNSTLLEGDAAEAVRKLKAGPGKALQVIGSGDFAQTLMANDLVDEYRLMIYPIVLGTGKRLFRESGPIPLKLVSGTTTERGVQIVTYVPDRAGTRSV